MKNFTPAGYARPHSPTTMYTYRRLHPARQTSIPSAPPNPPSPPVRCLTAISVPMPMPKTKHSMIYEETIHTSTSEVAVTEKMLSELTKHVEDAEAGGDNMSDI